MQLSLILRKVNASYDWGGKEDKLNHLLFMDDLKLFSKNEHQIDSLVSTCHIFSTDIGMAFGLKKCGILTLKRGKVARCEGIKLPHGERLARLAACRPCVRMHRGREELPRC